MSMVESEILARVISPDDSLFDKKVAETILKMGFKKPDQARMDKLSEKARLGTLTRGERTEAESYERIGHFISLLKSKARRSLV